MLERLVNGLGKLMMVGGLTVGTLLASANAHADDIKKGARGPTDWQGDVRSVTTVVDNKSSSTLLSILKYWNGDQIGTWFFAGFPYALNTESGLNGYFIGGGLRGKVGDTHWLSFLRSSESNGTYKWNIGSFISTFFQDGKYEVTGSIDYGLTDKSLNMGFVAGGDMTDEIRLAPGLKVSKNKGGYSVDHRWALRYTPSRGGQRVHFEILHDIGVRNSRGYSTTALARINIGGK